MACINLGQNYAKITHLGKKNIFFGEISLNLVLSNSCVLSHSKIWQKNLSSGGSWNISLLNVAPQSGQNCSFGLKEDLFRYFTPGIFI